MFSSHRYEQILNQKRLDDILTGCADFDIQFFANCLLSTMTHDKSCHLLYQTYFFFLKVEMWVEERGNSLVVPVMPWEQFSEEVTTKFGMKHLLTAITQYLHETGKVITHTQTHTQPHLNTHTYIICASLSHSLIMTCAASLSSFDSTSSITYMCVVQAFT